MYTTTLSNLFFGRYFCETMSFTSCVLLTYIFLQYSLTVVVFSFSYFFSQLSCLYTTSILLPAHSGRNIPDTLNDPVSDNPYHITISTFTKLLPLPSHPLLPHMIAAALPEDLVWEYAVQLASAVRIVHSQQLALRCLDPSKVLVSSRQRLRVGGCGIMDVITYDNSSTSSGSPTMHQVRMGVAARIVFAFLLSCVYM